MSRDSVKHLVDRLVIRYGQLWFRMWEGVDAGAVQADWERQLASFSNTELHYAFDNAPPNRVPTVAEFRRLCLETPAPIVPHLPAPKPSQAELERSRRIREQALAGLRRIGKGSLADTRQKAIAQLKDFEDRAARGERLSFVQRDWMAAAKPLLSDLQMPGDFRPIDTTLLPPAMQPDAHTVAPDGVE